MVGREGFAPQVEVEVNGKSKKFVSSFQFRKAFCSKDGRPQADLKIRVGEELKAFGAMKLVFNVRAACNAF